MGTIVETTVLRHLYAYYYRDTPEIVYWRDSVTNKEVDIIVRSPAYIYPFEVKYQESAELERTGGLVIYCKTESVTQAFLITKSERDYGVIQIPGIQTQFLKILAHILCYLLGQTERLINNSGD